MAHVEKDLPSKKAKSFMSNIMETLLITVLRITWRFENMFIFFVTYTRTDTLRNGANEHALTIPSYGEKTSTKNTFAKPGWNCYLKRSLPCGGGKRRNCIFFSPLWKDQALSSSHRPEKCSIKKLAIPSKRFTDFQKPVYYNIEAIV